MSSQSSIRWNGRCDKVWAVCRPGRSTWTTSTTVVARSRRRCCAPRGVRSTAPCLHPRRPRASDHRNPRPRHHLRPLLLPRTVRVSMSRDILDGCSLNSVRLGSVTTISLNSRVIERYHYNNEYETGSRIVEIRRIGLRKQLSMLS